jgi:hypothetical protein
MNVKRIAQVLWVNVILSLVEKTRYDRMCKIGSESHYILSLDALSASSCNLLNTRGKSLKSAVGIRLYGT